MGGYDLRIGCLVNMSANYFFSPTAGIILNLMLKCV